MRAEQDTAVPAFLDLADNFLAVNPDVELLDLVVEQEHSIEHAGAERQVVMEYIGETGAAPQSARQILRELRAACAEDRRNTDRSDRERAAPSGGPASGPSKRQAG